MRRYLRRAISASGIAGVRVIIIPGQPGKRIFVMKMFLWNVGAQNIEFFDGNAPSQTLSGVFSNFPATSGFSLPHDSTPHFDLSPGGDLVLALSAGTQVSGWVYYYYEGN